MVNNNLSADNIFFTADGRVKIGNFYLSSVIGAKFAYGQMPLMPHMSPECLTGGEITIASDVWSLGMMLHKLCCLEVL